MKQGKQIWFVTGSQHLYGDETLRQVAANSGEIATWLAEQPQMAADIVFKGIRTTPDEIYAVCRDANADDACIGVIVWMHTFSPAKMWIRGLGVLSKPLAHLHTQYNRDIPWSSIDMDFMNLNQAAHGDREFGFICSRMGIRRKVIAGFWQDPAVVEKLAIWIRAALAWADINNIKIARFGDNMREVAVTEGNKVTAQIQLGCAVNGYALEELANDVQAVTDTEIDVLLAEYEQKYILDDATQAGGSQRAALVEAARIELGMRRFLERGGFQGFTTTFENLAGLRQLPGLAVQRLMNDGYGFGAEGDWKTAALLRAVKTMAAGLPGGTSFMEDYTYHLEPGNEMVLGAHMLEVCESIAAARPRLSVQPLGIGGKEDPARLIFNTKPGKALNATLLDFGGRLRLLVNTVEVVQPEHELPNLPVAQALWKPQPSLSDSAEAWILAGGAHHTVFSQQVDVRHLRDFAEIAGIECLVIDEYTRLEDFKNQLRWNELYYR